MNGRRCVGKPSESALVTSYSGEDQTCPVNMMKNAHKSKSSLVAAGSLLLMVHQRFHCLQQTAPNLIKQKWRLCFFLPSALPLRLNICCLCCFSLKTWGKVLSDEVSVCTSAPRQPEDQALRCYKHSLPQFVWFLLLHDDIKPHPPTALLFLRSSQLEESWLKEGVALKGEELQQLVSDQWWTERLNCE